MATMRTMIAAIALSVLGGCVNEVGPVPRCSRGLLGCFVGDEYVLGQHLVCDEGTPDCCDEGYTGCTIGEPICADATLAAVSVPLCEPDE